MLHVKGTIIAIDVERCGQRLDNFLLCYFKNVPQSRIYRMVRSGEVRINKKRVLPKYKLQMGDTLRIPPYWQVDNSSKEQRKPSLHLRNLLTAAVIFEDTRIIVVNKPTGIASHGGSGINFGVVEILRQSKDSWCKLELVHRLDRDTSGCLILAKKRSALRFLHQLLRTGKIVKKYLLLVKGKWSDGERRVTLPLLKSQLSSGERMVKVNDMGKQALTVFRPLTIGAEYSLLEAELKTGRTHQIRVHAAALGYPIAGDEKYGEHAFNVKLKPRGLKRLFLHAWRIEFYWESGEPVKLQAQLPSDLDILVKTLFGTE